MLPDETKSEVSATYSRLKAKTPHFRGRRAQREMIGAIASALYAEAPYLVVEAPTGVGKTFGYLTSALPVAKALKRHLVISTGTVSLQEQLVTRDIPAFLTATDTIATVVLAKGRGRYACPARMSALLHEDQTQTELALGEMSAVGAWPRAPRQGEPEKVARLLAALHGKQWNGDLDAPPQPVDDVLLPLLSTTAGGCSSTRCAHYFACPFFEARRSIAKADVIVVNHSLLLADLLREGESDEHQHILPPPDEMTLVVDEAHQFAEVAISQGATEVALASTTVLGKKLVDQARGAYRVCGATSIANFSVETGIEHLQALTERLLIFEQRLFDEIHDKIEGEPKHWLAPMGVLPAPWAEDIVWLASTTGRVRDWLRLVRVRVLSGEGVASKVSEAMARELGLHIEALTQQLKLWQLWSPEDAATGAPPIAKWVTEHEGRLVLHASPVSAAGNMRRMFWPVVGGAVLTSATLAIGGRFNRFAAQIGLPRAARTLCLESPFDLPRQATLLVPRLKALPSEFEEHVQECADWLDQKLDWSHGNLVYFTSKRKLLAVLERIDSSHRALVRAQGSSARSVLLREHATAIASGNGSTIFALNALGEGIDLPGKLCETVVITQIPFPVPTDPVGMTYSDWLESQGRNSFVEVSVPDATRTLAQVCGRLIRSETDSGRIVVLDRRMVTKRYGPKILKDLPNFSKSIEHASSSASSSASR